jgi:hypothetical protein
MPKLPPPIGLSEDREVQVHDRWSTIEKVRKRLASRGMVIRDEPPPFPIPEVTTTLVDTDNQEYLRTNAQYLAWLNYIMPHIALVEGMLLEIGNEKAHIEALYRDQARRSDEDKPASKKTSKEETADNTLLDPRYIELLQAEQELREERDLLDCTKEGLSRAMRVISRHIEVKKLDADVNRTAANLTQRRPFNRTAFSGGGDV